jgi:hypothetical protein
LALKHGDLWLSESDINRNIKDLSATKTKLLLKAQINIQTNILIRTSDHLRTSNASVSELKQHVIKLIGTELPLEVDDLHHLIVDPQALTGHFILHKCEQ